MYNDNTNFSIKNIIIQFLFIALFIFILIWLFPLKSDLKGAVGTCTGDTCNNSVLYDSIFNTNVLMMKDSAKSYFTTPRLPKKIGDKVKLTLGEMLNLKIILPFVDKNGDTCSLDESYVEITKYEEEYIMKVNLKCGEQENYLLVYMGCYDYCSTTICEKNESDVKEPIIYPSKPEVKPQPKPEAKPEPKPEAKPEAKPEPKPEVKPDPKPEVKPDPKPEVKPDPKPEKEYLYEYVKKTDGYYKYSDWSEWQTTEVKADANTSVKTKTLLQKKLIGYNVTTSTDKSQPIYGTKEVQIGTEEKTVCKKYDYVSTGEYSYSEYKYKETVYLTYTPKDTTTTKYVYVDEDPYVCKENCTAGTVKAYKVYTRTQTPVTKYECVETGVETRPVTTTIQVITGYKTTQTKEPVYETKTVKYYSYMTRTWIEGTTDTKWSIKNDTTLLSSGYSYTGNTKEVTK